MGYRVLATILETMGNPSATLPACRLCIERLHSLPAVQNCFTVEFKKGFRGRFSKDERRELILAVCRLNRVSMDLVTKRFLISPKCSLALTSITKMRELIHCLTQDRVWKGGGGGGGGSGSRITN